MESKTETCQCCLKPMTGHTDEDREICESMLSHYQNTKDSLRTSRRSYR